VQVGKRGQFWRGRSLIGKGSKLGRRASFCGEYMERRSLGGSFSLVRTSSFPVRICRQVFPLDFVVVYL